MKSFNANFDIELDEMRYKKHEIIDPYVQQLHGAGSVAGSVAGLLLDLLLQKHLRQARY